MHEAILDDTNIGAAYVAISNTTLRTIVSWEPDAWSNVRETQWFIEILRYQWRPWSIIIFP